MTPIAVDTEIQQTLEAARAAHDAERTAKTARPGLLLERLATFATLTAAIAQSRDASERRRLRDERADLQDEIDSLQRAIDTADIEEPKLGAAYVRAREAFARAALEQLADAFGGLAQRALALPFGRVGECVPEARALATRAREHTSLTGTGVMIRGVPAYAAIPLQTDPPLAAGDLAKFLAGYAAFRGLLPSPAAEKIAPAPAPTASAWTAEQHLDEILGRARAVVDDLRAAYPRFRTATEALTSAGVQGHRSAPDFSAYLVAVSDLCRPSTRLDPARIPASDTPVGENLCALDRMLRQQLWEAAGKLYRVFQEWQYEYEPTAVEKHSVLVSWTGLRNMFTGQGEFRHKPCGSFAEFLRRAGAGK